LSEPTTFAVAAAVVVITVTSAIAAVAAAVVVTANTVAVAIVTAAVVDAVDIKTVAVATAIVTAATIASATAIVAAFCAIFWLKQHGLMPGLCFSTELISCDEGLHCNFAYLLYSKLINKLTESGIVEIVSSAVKIKMEFVVNTLPLELIGMNLAMMCNYIRFCTDQLLLSFGCGHHYKIGNPFEWMKTISLQGKTNFFEKRVGEYSKSGVGIDRADQSFALDASF
jgi:ribonucleotide reductase beta subunit family protein with ferritin-like domain